MFFQHIAESCPLEEVSCDLQLLLCPENHSSHRHVRLLLRRHARDRLGPRGGGSEVGLGLHSFHHYTPQRSRNSKVHFLLCLKYVTFSLTKFHAIVWTLCRSFHLLMFWILFENVMSLHRTKATLIGLLEAGRVNEWIVTDKLGDALKAKAGAKTFKKPRFRIGDR